MKKPNPKTVASLAAQIDACKVSIAAERDKLRELINETESIIDDSSEAIEDLNRAVETLSKYL